jgi:penicillin-binding protein 1A
MKERLAMARGATTTRTRKPTARPKAGRWLRKLGLWGLGLGLAAVVVVGLFLVGFYFYLCEDLPRIATLADYRPPVVTAVYSDDGRKIGELFDERRIVTPMAQIPELLTRAFIAAEDSRFFTHQGIDIWGIVRALFKNIEAGTIVQGGSTITQQVTKSFFLSPEKSYIRKAREAILAYRIDKAFSKQDVLFLYLNQIYLGHGAYGVAAAAETYFGKALDQLTLAECALLAGLPQAPTRYSPFSRPQLAKDRQVYVLQRMAEEGYITAEQAAQAAAAALDFKPRRNLYLEEAPVYTESVRRDVERKYGRDTLYREGLQIYTAVNIEMQKTAQKHLEIGLEALDKRQGYRGPLRHLDPSQIEDFCRGLQQDQPEPKPGARAKAVVIGLDPPGSTIKVRLGGGHGQLRPADADWARKLAVKMDSGGEKPLVSGFPLRRGDVVEVKIIERLAPSDLWRVSLEQTPKVQGALVAIEVETGLVKAMVGGRDFQESQFNRAVQARRQPGSAFKPIVYAAAIDKGFTPASIIIDSPIALQDSPDHIWKPSNYDEKFVGPIMLRDALAQSRNVVTVKILQAIGVDYAIKYARRLGITAHLDRNLSLALGSSGIPLMELVKAYSVFANQGALVEPILITRIVDRDGRVMEKAQASRKQVIEQSTAYIMTSLLESVVQEGTAKRAIALNRPAAGKTGTTNDLIDAWFVGFTPQYVAGAWVGFDEEASLGKAETGARAALPIWLGFMQDVHKDKPVKVFQVPEGVVFAKIDAQTGKAPGPESTNVIFECFKEGTPPAASQESGSESHADPEDFFKTIM